MKILLANPRGFCAGVVRAIETVERALKRHGKPIYVRHEVVHNKFVVDKLKTKGAIFVEEIRQVPQGEVVIFSAHGVSQSVRREAQKIKAIIYDATCPLVTKVHKEVSNKQKQNHQVILIGHKGHPEVEGTLGQSSANNTVQLVENIDDLKHLNFSSDDNLAYTTQTTLSVDDTQQIVSALKRKFAHIQSPKKEDICYATQNRQDAVKKLMQSADMLLVLGSNNSSNSNRLREIALKMQKPAYLIDSAKQINASWLQNIKVVGVTAGASAPEILVQAVVDCLCKAGADEVIEMSGTQESVHFPVAKILRN